MSEKIAPLSAGSFQKPEDFLAKLPIKMSPREFRRRLRAGGHCYEHRKQLFLTEEKFLEFVETLKVEPPKCRLSSKRSEKSGTSMDLSTESAFERAQRRIVESTLKHREKSFSAT